MDENLKQIPIGKWEVLREGNDLSILTFGTMIPSALEAADSLAKQGIQAEVINARSVKPLDEEMLLELARKNGPVLTVEEAALQGGFGSAVLEFFHENSIHTMVVERMGVPDRFIEHGSVAQLWEEIGLTPENIVRHAKKILPRKRQRA